MNKPNVTRYAYYEENCRAYVSCIIFFTYLTVYKAETIS